MNVMKSNCGGMINKVAAVEQTKPPLANTVAHLVSRNDEGLSDGTTASASPAASASGSISALPNDFVINPTNATINTVFVNLNSREARNLAEKNRRDKLNASIQQLATMVPHAAEATKRLDKTAVLRFATHGLRLRYVFGKTQRKRKYSEWSNRNTDSLLKLLDSFLITLTCSGQIVLVSSSVEQLLGHCQSDLYGQNILQITHPDDQALLRQQLIPNDIEALFTKHSSSSSSSSTSSLSEHNTNSNSSLCSDSDSLDSIGNDRPIRRGNGNGTGTGKGRRSPASPFGKSTTNLDDIDERLKNDKRSFTIRLARASTRSEAIKQYELVNIDGNFRRSDYTSSSNNSYPIVSQLIRRSRSNMNMDNGNTSDSGNFAQQFIPHDAIAQAALHGISGNDIVLVAMARILKQPSLITNYIDSNSLEYKTRHLIDGRIVECDSRISLVAGYMKEEVRNLSPFSFMHQDDVRWVIVALRQMYDCNSNFGESCYRLLSRNGHFIYLHTRGYMEIDKVTNKIHSFICINTLLDEEDGKRRVQAMKDKFSTIIKAKIPNSSSEDLPASQNPQQLEKIVLYLIENLQKRNESESTVTLTELPESPMDVKTLSSSGSSTSTLALVPPEPESIKSSITQSVKLVNVTAAKNIVSHQQHQQQQHEQQYQNQRQLQRQQETISQHQLVKPIRVIPMDVVPISSKNLSNKIIIHLNNDLEVPENLIKENTSLNANTIVTTKEIQRPSVLQIHCTLPAKRRSSNDNPQQNELTLGQSQSQTQNQQQPQSQLQSQSQMQLQLEEASLVQQESITPTLARLLSQPVKLNHNKNYNSNLMNHPVSPNAGSQILKRVLSTKSTTDTSSSSSAFASKPDHSPAKRSVGSQASLTTITSLSGAPALALLSNASSSSTSAYSSGNLSSSPSFSLYSTDSPLSALSSIPSSSPEIHYVLSESFENLDYSLQSIDQNARSLCSQNLVPPSIEHELDDILLENEKHRELLINIKSEYDDYLHEQHLSSLLDSPTTPTTLTRTSSLGNFQLDNDSL